MKTIVAYILILMICLSGSALAELDVHNLTDEELIEYRRAITAELASRNKSHTDVVDGVTIEELFPDEWIADHVRDELGKFSVTDAVSQDELNTIRKIKVDGQTTDHIQITTLEGIQYLHNLESLYINDQENIKEIPDWIGSLTQLSSLTFRYCPAHTLPDSVCELTNLNELNLFGSDIEALPEEIGNLENLNNLDIRDTQITQLPESIHALNLKKFRREGLNIEE